MEPKNKNLPIVVSVYDRVDHFKRCIDSLSRNDLASSSKIYILSDAPKSSKEEPAVAEIRRFSKRIECFGEVELIARSQNMGAIPNGRQGIEKVLREHGRVIFMEDDLVTAPGFLSFMNDAYNFYSNNKNIFSISGYCPPIDIPSNLPYDVFMLPRFCAWGVAISEASYFSAVHSLDESSVRKQLENRHFVRKLKSAGDDVLDMLELELQGRINAYDVRAMYYHALHNMMTVYPRQSLVRNVGFDGTGIHCGATNRFDVDLWTKEKNFVFPSDASIDQQILRKNRNFRSHPPLKKIERWFKKRKWVRQLRGR